MSKEMRKLSRYERAILAEHNGLYLSILTLHDAGVSDVLLTEFDSSMDNFRVPFQVPVEIPELNAAMEKGTLESIIKADLAARDAAVAQFWS